MEMKKGPDNPTSGYLLKGRGGGTSSQVKGGQKDMLIGGAKDSSKQIIGGKRYTLGSGGSRKM